MKVRGQNGDMKIEPTYEEPRRAIFGIRSCDVAGLWHLDRFYLGRDFRDVYYEKRRKNLFLVNVVCTDPARDIGEDCFCLCADTGPAAREHFDLQLMDLGDGEFMAVAGTPAGEELFAEPIFRKGTAAHLERRQRHSGRGAQAVPDHHELVSRHRPLRFAGHDPGQDLGGNRQPLPGMRRLHLCLSRLHLFHRLRPPGGAG